MHFQRLALSFLVFLNIVSCTQSETQPSYDSVDFTMVLEQEDLSIRALEILAEDSIAIAFNKGFGIIKKRGKGYSGNRFLFQDIPAVLGDSVIPSLAFRSIAATENKLFAMSIGNPATLISLENANSKPSLKIVYSETNDKVFYDSMAFWNENEGIAIGDPTDNCMSIVVTADAGKNWQKLSCFDLPEAIPGEAAFAASDTNIKLLGDNVWILSGGMASRVYHSGDSGLTWTVVDTPLIQGTPTTGGYSMDFYDEKNGFIIGGDYTQPDDNSKNKAVTSDGGKTWNLVSDGKGVGYKSCVQYVPNSNGKILVATGATGISVSKDSGESWKDISTEGFYTIRFLNDSVAYASGKGRVAKLKFN